MHIFELINDVESNLYESLKSVCVFGDNFDRNGNLNPVDVGMFLNKKGGISFFGKS